MPTVQNVTTLAAGASNNNVLAGSAYEFVRVPSKVYIGVVGDAPGAMRATVQAGSDTLLEESPLSRQARFPVWPDDFTLSDMLLPGDRIKIGLRNTGAVAADTFWAVRIEELG